jgi:type II secretory pathway component PulM
MTPAQFEALEDSLAADIGELVVQYVARIVEPLKMRLDKLEAEMQAIRANRALIIEGHQHDD